MNDRFLSHYLDILFSWQKKIKINCQCLSIMFLHWTTHISSVIIARYLWFNWWSHKNPRDCVIININKYNHSYDHIAQFKVVLRFIVLRATACMFHGHYKMKSCFKVRGKSYCFQMCQVPVVLATVVWAHQILLCMRYCTGKVSTVHIPPTSLDSVWAKSFCTSSLDKWQKLFVSVFYL